MSSSKAWYLNDEGLLDSRPHSLQGRTSKTPSHSTEVGDQRIGKKAIREKADELATLWVAKFVGRRTVFALRRALRRRAGVGDSQTISEREAKALDRWRGCEDAYPGKKALLRIDRRTSSSRHARERGKKRIPSIRVAAGERGKERLSGIRIWRLDYKACMKRWPTDGVVFPMGTNKMRVVHRVNVDSGSRLEVGAFASPP